MGHVYHTPDGRFLAHTEGPDDEFEWQLRAQGQPFHRFEDAPHPAEDPFPANALLRRTQGMKADGTVGTFHAVHYADGRIQPLGDEPAGPAPRVPYRDWGTPIPKAAPKNGGNPNA